MAKVVDLNLRYFKQCGDLGNFWRLLESGQLVSRHGEVGTWHLLDIMTINLEKLKIEIVSNAQIPLRIDCVLAGGCGGRRFEHQSTVTHCNRGLSLLL